jgi:hypothetical protein
VCKTLNQKGVYSLLSGDGDLFTALVAISLHPFAASRDVIRTRSNELDLDGDKVFDELMAAVHRTGAQFVMSHAGNLWCRT